MKTYNYVPNQDPSDNYILVIAVGAAVLIFLNWLFS
jgi:hypothetical protein